MRVPKQSRSVAVWLVVALTVILGFKVTPTVVQAGLPLGQLPQPLAAAAAVPPPLPAAVAAAIISPARVLGSAATKSGLPKLGTASDLPPVEEFVLTPPNPAVKVYKTTLSLRFSSRAAERLAASVTTNLGDQRVLFQRSADDPAIYSAAVDFNWNAFTEEQERRQAMANDGTTIPVFDGHRLQRMERMQFIDPAEIRQALQSHQPIHFTSQVLQGNPVSVLPDHELLINGISVVEDQTRTWDPCSRTGRQMGAWTFGALMTAIANDDPTTHLVADVMVQTWLGQWSIQQNINHFPVSARLGMIGVLRGWRNFAHDSDGNIDISQAPFQLNAIVNRMDFTSAANPSGELRFVFGYAPCQGSEGLPAAFNVILEYHVPVAQCSWAAQWHNLDLTAGPRFNMALQNITDQVAKNNASQNLNQVRTNEAFTDVFGIWEQKQFALMAGALKEVPVAQTPNGDTASGRIDFNQSTCTPNSNCQAGVLTNYVNTFQQDILDNDYTVPLSFPGQSPFLGGSTLNGPFNQFHHQLVYWQGNPAPNNNQARSIFSENTCNGCHGRETFVEFQQVVNRQPGPPGTAMPAVLSAFLVGCSTSSQSNPLTDQTGPCAAPPTNACTLQNTLTHNPACIAWVRDPADPSGHTVNQFAEISRRAQNMSTVLQGCRADGMLQSLAVQRLSSGH